MLENVYWSILKAKDTIADKVAVFENTWDDFITDLRADVHTRYSWYTIGPIYILIITTYTFVTL